MEKEKIKLFCNQNKKILISIVALLEAIMVICVATFSWIEGTKDGTVRENEDSIVSAGAGLMFEDIEGNAISKIKLPSINLEDCSSVDGRNFFFPTTESEGTATNKYVFRAGTDADKNTKYISTDFTVESLATSKIFIDINSSVRCADENQGILNAIRISLNFNDGSEPIVFCPGLISGEYHEINNAVLSINTSGTATTTQTDPHAFNEYYYSTDNPVATVNAGETKRVTFSMWLEGTDNNCLISNIPSNSINVNLVLSTTENRSKTIKFIDYSPNSWIKNKADNGKEVNMYAIDKSTIINGNFRSGARYYMERQSDGITYIGSLPEEVDDVMFARFDPNNSNIDYNTWAENESMSTCDLDEKTYYAIGRGKDVDKVNYGYWVKSSCTGVVDLYLTEANKGEIYFTNTNNWNDVKAYFYKGNSDADGSWPGRSMIKTTDEDESYSANNYKIGIPSNADGVIFNGAGGQTVDIPLNNNKDKGYYLTGSKTGDKYNVSAWSDSTRSSGVFSNYVDSGNITAPNLYYQSSIYGDQIYNVGIIANSKGLFDPRTTSSFNKDTNFGLAMEYAGDNDQGQHVYHLIIPADATNIRFNGYGNSWVASTGSLVTNKNSGVLKKGYWYTSSNNNDTWTPDNSWPKNN